MYTPLSSMRAFFSVWRHVAAAITVVTAGGCIGEQGVAPSARAPDATLGTIQASPLNVVMAVGQTTQITVTGKTISGDPITSFDSVVYLTQSTTDSVRVQVSASGLVTARGSSGSNPVLLNVYAFKGELVRADQVIIQVTDVAVSGAGLSIQPQAGDSTKLAIGNSKSIIPMIGNSAGDSVPYPTFRLTFHTADLIKVGCYTPNFPGIGAFNSQQLSITPCGSATGFNELRAQTNSGTVWVIADAMVYGVHLRDSVQYTLTNPYSSYIFVYANNLSVGGTGGLVGTIQISPSGVIQFDNSFDMTLGTSVDFVFDNPGAATAADPPSTLGGSSGNIIGLNGGESSYRRFMTAGTYNYTATVHGSIPPFTGATVKGQIVVQ